MTKPTTTPPAPAPVEVPAVLTMDCRMRTETFRHTTKRTAVAAQWEAPDRLPAWLTCPVNEFMRHLRRVEEQRGIFWQRDDAYSKERGSIWQ